MELQRILLIDGENTRKIILTSLSKKEDFLNVNLNDLLESVLPEISFDKKIWFAARIKVAGSADRKKSMELANHQRDIFNSLNKQGIEINLSGRIQNFNNVFKEKGVDVAIATELVYLGVKFPESEIYIFSSDTDLIPAIIKAREEGVKVFYIGFKGRNTRSFDHKTDGQFEIDLSNI